MIIQTADRLFYVPRLLPFFTEIYITLWKLSDRRYRHGGGQASFMLSEKVAAFSDLKLIHTGETLIVSILNTYVTFRKYTCNI